MMYKQTKLFYEDEAGKVPGLCLANTRKGYGIAPKYADAWTAWLNTEQHKDRNFPPLFVPIYFSYTTTIGGVKKNYGHIGVRYPDGRFWTDGRMFASLKAYEDWGKPEFVGWGESINDVKVIEKVAGKVMITKEQENELSILATGSYPGKAYDYRFTGTANWNACIQHWHNVSKTVGLIKRNGLLSKEVEVLKEELKKDGIVLKPGKYKVN